MRGQRTTATFVGTRSDVLQHASGCARGGGRGREGEATTGAFVAGVCHAINPFPLLHATAKFWGTMGGWGSRGAPRAPRVRRATTPCFQHGHKLRNATTPQGPRWREGGGRRQGCGGDLIVQWSAKFVSTQAHVSRDASAYTHPTEGAGSRQAAELRRARTGFHPISIFVRVALVVAAGKGRRGGGEQG